MNKSSRKQHAYFKKFLVSHSLCHSRCLNDNPMDNVKSWVQNQPEGKALFTVSIYTAALASAANTCAFMCAMRPSMELFEMEMKLPSSMCLNITCRGFGVDNYAAGCVMFMHLCMCKRERHLLKQILR